VLDVRSYVTAAHPEQIRVTLMDGDQLIVYTPTVAPDSTIAGSTPNGSGFRHVQIPMSEVKAVEMPTSRAPSTNEVLWVVAGVAAIVAAIKVL
jgi:hypothetical protein